MTIKKNQTAKYQRMVRRLDDLEMKINSLRMLVLMESSKSQNINKSILIKSNGSYIYYLHKSPTDYVYSRA